MLKIKNEDLKELIIEVVDQSTVRDFIIDSCGFNERLQLLESSKYNQLQYFSNPFVFQIERLLF